MNYGEIYEKNNFLHVVGKAGCTAMAISSTDTMGDNSYCVRRLEEKRLLQELFG